MALTPQDLNKIKKGIRFEDRVYGTLNGKTDFHELGNYNIEIGEEKVSLKDLIFTLIDEITINKEDVLKLNHKIKKVALAIKDLKEKVGM